MVQWHNCRDSKPGTLTPPLPRHGRIRRARTGSTGLAVRKTQPPIQGVLFGARDSPLHRYPPRISREALGTEKSGPRPTAEIDGRPHHVNLDPVSSALARNDPCSSKAGLFSCDQEADQAGVVPGLLDCTLGARSRAGMIVRARQQMYDFVDIAATTCGSPRRCDPLDVKRGSGSFVCQIS